MTTTAERIDTVVVGGGQAGLAVGYELMRRGVPFTILEARERVGDAWRERWDSLRLFTPARYDALPGMPFPAPRNAFPSKDQMADYLEAYAERHALPVRTGLRVERLSRDGDRFVVATRLGRIECDNVVIAMSSNQRAKVPAFAADLDPAIVQLHASDYRGPRQVPEGDVLVVGAANSGAEIALELSRRQRVMLSGRSPGQIPFPIESPLALAVLMPLVLRGVFHRVLTVGTPVGRRVRPRFLSKGDPLVRTREGELEAAGVERVPRTVAVRDGRPLLDDGRAPDVGAVVWCTGYEPGLEWVDLPVRVEGREGLRHARGVVPEVPGLFAVGLRFLYAHSSEMIHGVGRDARRVARAVAARRPERAAAAAWLARPAPPRPAPAQRGTDGSAR